MKPLAEILRNADPLTDEPPRSAHHRATRRQMVLDAAVSIDEMHQRRVAHAAAVALAMLAVVAAAVYWSRSAVDVIAAVRFEVRLAEDAPTLGLRDAVVAGTTRRIYLHAEPVVTNGDIAGADVIQGDTPTTFGVAVAFSPGGAAKMLRATESHIGRPIAILVDGQVISAPTLRSRISSSAVISGNFTKTEADRIASGLIGR